MDLRLRLRLRLRLPGWYGGGFMWIYVIVALSPPTRLPTTTTPKTQHTHTYTHTHTHTQVLVTPLNGDPDVYATLGPAPGMRPSSDSYHFKSAKWGQSQDRIALRVSDPEFQRRCPDTRCRLRVGVYGFHDAAFGVLLSTHAAPVLLQQDVPFENPGLPPGGYQRFAWPWHAQAGGGDDTEDAVITLNRQSSGGRLRLFASCSSAWPNATEYDWAMDAGISQVLRIEGAEGRQKGCAGSTLTLAVLADGPGAAAFSLLASTDAPTSVPLLIPGLPTFGLVGGLVGGEGGEGGVWMEEWTDGLGGGG
jgi:hypothetical protein